MNFDLQTLSGDARNKLMQSLVVPRPIALVVTTGPAGLNAAPFSFFNMISGDPPLIAIGIGPSKRSGDGMKDTALNILSSGQLVVNMVTEELAESMNVAAAPFPRADNELAVAGLATTASDCVDPPRITRSPVSLECELVESLELDGRCRLFVAEVLMIHVDDQMILAADQHYVDGSQLGFVAKMHGGGWYARTSDLFRMPQVPLTDISRLTRVGGIIPSD